MGGKKKYINIFGSFTEPFNYIHFLVSNFKKIFYVILNEQIGLCYANKQQNY